MSLVETPTSVRKTPVFHLGRGTMSVLLSGDETDGRVESFDFVVPPGHPGPSLHIHDRADEFFTIVDGEAEFVIDGRKAVVAAGSQIVATRGLSHAWRNASDRPLRLVVSFSPAVGMERYFAELTRIAKTSWPPSQATLRDLWSRCDTRPA